MLQPIYNKCGIANITLANTMFCYSTSHCIVAKVGPVSVTIVPGRSCSLLWQQSHLSYSMQPRDILPVSIATCSPVFHFLNHMSFPAHSHTCSPVSRYPSQFLQDTRLLSPVSCQIVCLYLSVSPHVPSPCY